MTARYEKLIAELLKEAEEQENTCIRNYGSVPRETESALRAIREMAPTLRTLACHCYLSGVNLKITR